MEGCKDIKHKERYLCIDNIHNRWDGKRKISLGVEFVLGP